MSKIFTTILMANFFAVVFIYSAGAWTNNLRFPPATTPEYKYLHEENIDGSLKYPDIWFDQGEKFYSGNGVSVDYEQAFYYWDEISKRNNYAKAEYRLGLLYFYGRGVSKNYKLAVKWLLKAALQDYIPASYQLGGMYYQGLNIEQNYNEARKWFYRGAMRDDLGSMYALGLMYYNGEGGEKDYTSALRLWLPCARAGNADAQYGLGTMYESGWGVDKDMDKAREWYDKAAQQGHESALGALEEMAGISGKTPDQ